MTKPLIGLLAAFAATIVPATASASCFFIYNGKNELVYRSTIAPVDLSRPISDAVRSRFPGGHLVMIPEEKGCPDLLISGESTLYSTLGFSNQGSSRRSTSAIEASPLFRNGGARPGADAGDVDTSASGDSVPRLPAGRSGAPAGAARGK